MIKDWQDREELGEVRAPVLLPAVPSLAAARSATPVACSANPCSLQCHPSLQSMLPTPVACSANPCSTRCQPV